MRDKSFRDGRILSMLATLRKRQRSGARPGTTIIVSSSTRMRSAARAWLGKIEGPECVLPIAAVGFLLALAPGVATGLTQVRKVLFDRDFVSRMSGFERLAQRVLVASEELDLFASRRTTLNRKLRDGLIDLARQQGRSPRDIEEEFAASPSDNAESIARLIADSVDRISASRSEKLLYEKRAEADELRKELAKERQKRKDR